MAEKPSYLGMLNAIANAERRGHTLLKSWADKSTDSDVSGALNMVAIREAEHAWAFEKRICELGFSLKEKDDPNFQKTLDIVCSELSDLEKFEKLGYNKPDADADETDGLLQLLGDKSIDPQTGELLGRFIAEERDSGRALRAAYQCAKDKGNGQAATSPEFGDTLNAICTQLQELTAAVNAMQKEKGGRKTKAA
ncbi:MAG: hypothetical protein AAF512_11860 [Pseudomonadota bacterium]